jgi:hypothetical protein
LLPAKPIPAHNAALSRRSTARQPKPPRRSPSRRAIRAARDPPPLSLQSHRISRSYTTNLPTSLTNIRPSDERLLTSKTCCGLQYGCIGCHRLTRCRTEIFTDAQCSADGDKCRKTPPLCWADPSLAEKFTSRGVAGRRKPVAQPPPPLPIKKKRKLFPRRLHVSPRRFAFRRRPVPHLNIHSPGILTGFPFGGWGEQKFPPLAGPRRHLRTASLGAECLDPETLLHFRLQAALLNRRYCHQDRHWRPLQPGSRLSLLRQPPRRPTRRGALLTPPAASRFASPPALAPSIFGASQFDR